MTVEQMIAELQKLPPKANVRVAVGWAEDTAISDEEDVPTIRVKDTEVEIRGWLSNTGGALERLVRAG